ncbi:MAG: hypothetical protein PHC80_06410, partial [Eubacteriales bacterium]|nr:hypothetical protein [Eubacteriales bacterium]
YDGVLATRLLLMKDWERALTKLHKYTDTGDQYDGWHIKDNSTYFHFMFCCDMCKLYDFLTQAVKNTERRVIYCYNWQEEMLNAAIEALGIEKGSIEIEAYTPMSVMRVYKDQLDREDAYRSTHNYLGDMI